MTSISEWLQSVNLGEYAPRFEEQEITLDLLPHLTEADITALGLPIGPRRRLLLAIQALGAPPAPPAPPAPRPRTTGARPRPDGVPSGAWPRSAADLEDAERRQLTVVFCDLVGSTQLAEHLDAEELMELMQAYRAACGEIVERYDGHVAQYLGDGLMAYFGWPRAHEDDAERGVRAALEMVRVVTAMPAARPLAVRVGIATGTVVVGDPSRHDPAEAMLAVGETPNLAARLQGVAGPGEVVVAPATRRLVAEAFTFTDLGSHRLKGLAQPVNAWRVDAPVSTEGRITGAHSGRHLAPLLGREEECALLLRRWEQAGAGEGQVVLLGGQAGIGKSRLIKGLRERIPGRHRSLHFQCSPYHLHSPLYPFTEQFEYAAGFTRDDDAEARLAKMEATLRGGPDVVAERAPLFAALLSLPTGRYPALGLSPQKQKERTLEALADQFEALAREEPVLLIVEDLHWADPTSQEFLELLVQRVRGMPALLMMTYRLEYLPAWAGRLGVSTLTLNRLDREQGRELVETVTAGRSLPAEVLEAILARTDGVPLFVEELTRSVLESGLLREDGNRLLLDGPLTAMAIPASLRDSLMARLDHLGPAKAVAQMGACIGREFSFELLERIAAEPVEELVAHLDRLHEASMVTRRGTPPTASYTFRHALVQDAAYDSLLKRRRADLHARIAEVMEEEAAAGRPPKPESLAHHHTQAGHVAQAIPLWRQAGTDAVRRVALQEAVAHFQQGLALVGELPPSPDRDALELSIREPLNAAWTGLHGWAAPEVAENAAAILQLAESQGNTRSLLLALWWVWTNTITQGRIADSGAWVRRFEEEAERTGDRDMRIFGHTTAMVQHFLTGRLAESRAEAERALALDDPERAGRWLQLLGHHLRTFVEVYYCQLLWMLGYPEQALALSEKSSADARSDGHAFSLVWALTFSAYVYAYRREPARLRARLADADHLAREQGLAFIYEVSVPQAQGIVELQENRPREAIALLQQGLERWVAAGGNVRVPFVKSALAEALAREGDLDTALGLLDECLEQVERPAWEERVWLAELQRLKGWVLLQLGRGEAAESLLRASVETARRQQARSWELRAATTLAGHLVATGRPAEAREVLAPVTEWFQEGLGTPDLVAARALLEGLPG